VLVYTGLLFIAAAKVFLILKSIVGGFTLFKSSP